MSKNFSHPLKYKRYIKNPLTVNEIDNIYKLNKIKAVRADLYRDYVLSLCDLVFKSYLGDKHHQDFETRLEHFKWCWKENHKYYKQMGYKLRNDKKKYDYFESFFLDVYYFVDDKNNTLEDSIKNVWSYIFNYDVVKSKWDVDNFLEIYYMFDKSKWYYN
jgi:hypothetical protein